MELAPYIHAEHEAPILMLTAMGETEQRIDGFEAGVDDYLVKPFEPQELILRIQAILRRTGVYQPAPDPCSYFGTYRYDPASKQLFHEDEALYLTTAEQLLLDVLVTHAGEPVSRETLSQAGHVSERSVDVQINRLRQKIETTPKKPRYIQTVRGKGYALKVSS